MSSSKRIGCVLGPALMAVLASEFPLVQPRLYDEQIPPVVYLSGVIMFVAGLGIVRAHNLWRTDWTILVTLCGWFLLALGLVRMFAAGAYQRGAASAGTSVFTFLEAALFIVAAIITFNSYKRDRD